MNKGLSALKQRILSKRAVADGVVAARSTAAKKTPKTLQKQSRKSDNVLKAGYLTRKYAHDLQLVPDVSEIAHSQFLFKKASISIEWSAPTFEDVPQPDVELKNKAVDLPEVMFIGKSNVGKSSLLNALCQNGSKLITETFARSSPRAGYTRTINCFNIGGKLRLVDTPGYGAKSYLEQGEAVVDYIMNRKQLRRVYVLLNSDRLVSHEDLDIISGLLASNGVPHSIVFTKVDKITPKQEEFVSESVRMIRDEVKQGNLTLVPDFWFTSAQRLQGIPELRFDISNTCGIEGKVKLVKSMMKGA